MLQKETILNIKNVYTANAFQTDTGYYIGAGSETEPVVQLYDLANQKMDLLNDCPGGMMSYIPVPGHGGSYVSIMGLFPPFIGKEAGLFLHQKTEQGWKTMKAMELPFAHRCEIIKHEESTFLVAASVSRYKENPADWTRPGELHIISLQDNLSPPWKSEIIDSGITRNHGMIRTIIDETESICVSGAEGVFKIVPGKEGAWEVKAIFNKEVSEITFLDLNGDGFSELITIEPFHGNTLNIYKKQGDEWELKFSDSLSFGHGLSSGFFNDAPVIVVGNRADSLALEIFTINDLSQGLVNRVVIEEDAGPTQTQVFSYKSKDYILSTNQRKNEVALYTGTLD